MFNFDVEKIGSFWKCAVGIVPTAYAVAVCVRSTFHSLFILELKS